MKTKLKKILSPELDRYVHAYISAWLREDSWPKTEKNQAKLVSIHNAWPFYVAHGFFETEEFYGSFLEENGMELLPEFLQLMDDLQESRKSIFMTDGNPRKVPFPPAFQAAFFKSMKSGIESGVGKGFKCWTEVLGMMRKLGMTRIHQSARQGDYHIIPIDRWMHFLESIAQEEKGAWKRILEVAEGKELIKTWLDINRDWYEHTTNHGWAFSPKTEQERFSELSSDDWYYGFRNGFSKEAFIRCLETTGAEHLHSLLRLGYAKGPDKFHCSLGHGEPYDVFLQEDFEQAIEFFLFSIKPSRPDAEAQRHYIGRALRFLKILGIKKFSDGFDVTHWATILADNHPRSDVNVDSKSELSGEADAELPKKSLCSALYDFLRDGWAAMRGEASFLLKEMLIFDYAIIGAKGNHALAPSGPLPSFGIGFLWGFFPYALLIAGVIGARVSILLLLGIVMIAPLAHEKIMRYAYFCQFASWRKTFWVNRAHAESTTFQNIKEEWETWYQAMTGNAFDCNNAALCTAIHQSECLAYAWDWASPSLVYYGDRKMFNEINMGLLQGKKLLLDRWQDHVSLKLFPRKPPAPEPEREISILELIAESHCEKQLNDEDE